MSESQECLAPKSSTGQRRFNNPMWVLNVDSLILGKLVTSTSPTSLNAKTLLPVRSCWEAHQRMSSTKWKETFTTVWVFPKTSIVIQDWFQEVVLLRWRSQPELMKKVANIRVLNNFHSRQVYYFINSYSGLCFGNHSKNTCHKLRYGCRANHYWVESQTRWKRSFNIRYRWKR